MKIHFYHTPHNKDAAEAFKLLSSRYNHVGVDQCDVIVVLGGDGGMLDALKDTQNSRKPLYGLNYGTVGFLLNPRLNDDENLSDIVASSTSIPITPLQMTATLMNGDIKSALGFNEVSLFREQRRTAAIRITVDDKVRMESLIGDGVMVSTPQGSTAYNMTAGGPILPIGCGLLALTPNNPFNPKGWKGAVLPADTRFRFDVIEPVTRPVSVTADSTEIRDIQSVTVAQAISEQRVLLFHPRHSLRERALDEQFIA